MAEYNNLSISQYYNNSSNHGSYQYQSVDELVNTFMAIYVGENKIIPKANRQDVFFFGRRALQEMNYDILRSKKTWEFELDNRMYIPVPHDFVGYTHVSFIDNAGIKRPLYPIKDTKNGFRPKRKEDAASPLDTDEWWETENVPIGSPSAVSTGVQEEDSVTLSNFSNNEGNEVEVHDFDYNDRFDELAIGQRFGLEPYHAQINGSFYFDYENGRLYFSPSLIGENILLEYITDGLAEDGGALIHKFAEEAWYKSVAYAIVSTGSNYSPATIQMLKKERFAELRKAKLRLSNYKSQELAQMMRNKAKWIKH